MKNVFLRINLLAAALIVCSLAGSNLYAVTGGPDTYGYRYRANGDAGGPVYNWIELAPDSGGSGTSVKSLLDNLDDGHYYGIPIGFNFNFYGNNYTTIGASTNGTLVFEDSYLGLGNICPIPASTTYTPERYIAHFWDDLSLSATESDILYKNFGNYTVIEYYHVSSFGNTAANSTWEIILYNNGTIVMQYQDAANIDAAGSYTVGIQENVTTGLGYSTCDASGTVSSGQAIEFYFNTCALTVNLGNDTTTCQGYVLDAGNPGNTYAWSTGETTQTINPLASGNYSVTVDNGTCTASDVVTLTISTTAATGYSVCKGGTVTTGLQATSSCAPASNIISSFAGSIDLTDPTYNRSSSLTPPYSASAVGTAVHYDTYTFTVSASGSYTFFHCGTINWDTHDAIYTDPFNPTSPATGFLGGGDDGGTSCSLGSNTTITLTAGTTYVFVAEAYDNTGTGGYTVTFAGPGNVLSSSTPATLDWYTASTGGSPIASGSSFNPVGVANSGLANTNTPGTTYYYVACSSAPDCRTQVAFTINPSPVVALGNDVSLCGGSTTLDAGNAGATFLWSDNSTGQTLSTSTAGTYSVTVTNSNSCSASDALVVTVNTPPTVNLGNDVIQCGGSVTVDAGNAGSTYAWSNSSTAQTVTVTAPASVNLSVTVTNSNNCTATGSKSVDLYTLPVVSLGNDVSLCGGSTTLDAGNAGATFLWSDNSTGQTLSTSTAGTYSVTVTNSNSCSASDALVVTVNTPPTVNLGNDVIQCGGSVTVDAGNAGSTYAWSNSSTAQTVTVTAPASVNLSVTVTNSNNCTATGSKSVDLYALPVVSLGNDVSLCGGSTTLDAGNVGSTYLWSDNSTSQTLSTSTAGTYSVTVTNSNSCSASDALLVTVNTPPTVDLGNAVTQCGGSVILDAGNAGSTYAWSNNSTGQTLSVTTTATYSVTVTDIHNCTATDNVDITINTIPAVTISLPQDSACSGSSAITLSGGSPTGGTFSGTNVSGTIFNPTTVGTYTVAYAYADGNGCKDTAYADITVYVCVGINDLTSGSVELYPNPANDYVTLHAVGITGKIQVEIFDVTGKKVEQINGVCVSSGYTHTVNLTYYAAGAYIVNVNTENGSVKYNLVVR